MGLFSKVDKAESSTDFDDEILERQALSSNTTTASNSIQRRRRMKNAMISGSVLLTLIVVTCSVVLLVPSSPKPTENPSQMPSFLPSSLPSTAPSDGPSVAPSDEPSDTPSSSPSVLPSMPPSSSPSDAPTAVISSSPSSSPSGAQSNLPSTVPTERPSTTQRPTASEPPSLRPSETPLNSVFYVIGDLPYSNTEKQRLIEHVETLPEDAEFLVHVGDIRAAVNNTNCTLSEFDVVGDILKQSPVPVFIVPGDNEYNDCPNVEESWADWKSVFGDFEKHWNTSLVVSRDIERPENFHFVYKRVLYIGLNIVGGSSDDEDEWEARLDHQWNWTKHLIDTHIIAKPSAASSVIIFAHADPRPTAHSYFFEPLQQYIDRDLNNTIPFLYVNGDRHYFQHDNEFYGQSNFHRIMVEGGSKEPPLRLSVKVPTGADHGPLRVEDVYDYDRFLIII